ncbi:MAG TPA: cupredoxin domain-containing protein [Candidatus Thermoplasmatota archaeon]|nr:cupredoxin domain-containing protein [Candidatus Thermoplasmatota archaeon]
MKAWLKRTLLVVAVVAVLYGAFIGFASYSNGHKVTVDFSLGTNADGSMYLRCTSASEPGVCGGDRPDQATVTVHKRDRVTFRIHNDDSGDHSHDFKLEGWQYALPPLSPESELHKADESWTFTAWAPGSFRLWCELKGHASRGMEGTFFVDE